MLRAFLILSLLVIHISLSFADGSYFYRTDHAETCPDLSKVEKFELKCPERKDGTFIPCNAPITLNIPQAYVTVDARRGYVFPAPYAVYDSLEPACTKFTGPGLTIDRDKSLRLELDRMPKADDVIELKIKEAQNPKVWKLVEDNRFPDYDRYWAFVDPKLDNSILVPKTREIDVPYVITCMNLEYEKTKPPQATCVLYTNYRGQLLVKTVFDAAHLGQVPQVYKKTTTLLDRFYEASSNPQ